MTLILLIVIPLVIFVEFNLKDKYKSIFVYFLTIQALNMILYLNVGFYDEGNLIMNRGQILKHYLKNYLFQNLFTFIVIETSFYLLRIVDYLYAYLCRIHE